ncbi:MULTISPECIES: isochorismate synthase MenF [Peribacillus]|uniref:isochorismate synthase n=1 Tax=Peribacillus TaxID=2675229 RepID=UPI00203EB0D2|nr:MULTISPECIES: isochorismate synthase [Peribacillus]MCM3677208.1 isochorismate synthase [Peribacillus simplex]MDQ0881839.1 menaquinone-specific isochorismate synthase [Peribacillus sp. V2I11]
MAISEETEQFQGLASAIQKAKDLNDQVLFSHIKKVNCNNPLSFYQAGRERYAGERFFWEDPAKEMTITGLGNVKKLKAASNAERYREVEKSWIKLQNTAVKTGVTDLEATGPLLFGGFSFDYETDSTLLWNQFGDNLFYIPAFMLSIVGKQAYLTTNLLCSPDDSEKLFIDMINEREAFLFESLDGNGLGANSLVMQREVEPEEWKRTVAEAVQEIKTTDLDKIVLARELRLVFERSIDSGKVLERLIAEQPLSYIFSLEAGGDCFVGATPERLIKKQGNEVFSTCLAGSMGRGKDEREDVRLGEELLHDQKNLQEHQYVVSMISNAFDSVCEKVMVPAEPALMKNRHIQHLYTPVRGLSKEGVTIFEFVENLHPTPAMGGLPKDKAVVRIREMEGLERGFYAGPLGWVDTYGNGEFAVGIRSALIQNNEASLFAGCGVVEDSTPESEFRETGIKFNPMLSALGGNLNE